MLSYTETSEIAHLSIYKMKEGKACLHPVHCFDGFQKVFKMSHISMFWGCFFNI